MVYLGVYFVVPEKHVFAAAVGGVYQWELGLVFPCSLHSLALCLAVLSVVEGAVLKFPVLTADLFIPSVSWVFIPRIFLCCLVHIMEVHAKYVHPLHHSRLSSLIVRCLSAALVACCVSLLRSPPHPTFNAAPPSSFGWPFTSYIFLHLLTFTLSYYYILR